MSSEDRTLAQWSKSEIDAECAKAYAEYLQLKKDRYRSYFADNPQLKDPNHDYKAKDFASALPMEAPEQFEQLLRRNQRHLHHRSGMSSQLIAIGILGSASFADPTGSWLLRALGLGTIASGNVTVEFEHDLKPEQLNESPHVTSVDLLYKDAAKVICLEAKWTEKGLGSCSCEGAPANCSDRVLNRPKYWKAASEAFGLPARDDVDACPIRTPYQAVRNAAAAIELGEAGGQEPVFALVYDANNPYFSGEGEWPGWPRVLHAAMDRADQRVQFCAASWQQLVTSLDLSSTVLEWAKSKHGLGASSPESTEERLKFA